jgi:hypothetical protein
MARSPLMSKISYNRNMHRLYYIALLYLRKVQPLEGIDGRYFSIDLAHPVAGIAALPWSWGGHAVQANKDRLKGVTRMFAAISHRKRIAIRSRTRECGRKL